MAEKARIYEPWPDDEIVFEEGYVIFRSERYGMYGYEVAGIVGRDEVDAEQLIIWHMAKLIVYEALTPWDDSDITLESGEYEVMRDLAHPASSDHDYILLKEGKLYAVNKFYLAHNGYAVAGGITENRAIRGGRQIGANAPWEEDGIALVPSSDYEVSKGMRAGFYSVKHGGIYTTYGVDTLILMGLAVDVKEWGYRKLESCKQMSWSDLKSGTYGYWRSGISPSSLREVAKVWAALGEGDTDLVKRVLKDYDDRIAAAKKINDAEAAADACVTEASKMSDKIKEALQELKKLCNVTITKMSEQSGDKREKLVEKIERSRNELTEYLNGKYISVTEALRRELDRIPSFATIKSELMPFSALPATSYWASKKVAYDLKRRRIEEACGKKSTLYPGGKFKYDVFRQSMKEFVDECEGEVSAALASVKEAENRKKYLDSLRPLMQEKRRKLLSYKSCLGWPSDQIFFIDSKLKIERGARTGRYVMTLGSLKCDLDAQDLIYLGVAEKYQV